MYKAELWRDNDGLLHPKSEVNEHHPIPQCRANSIVERRFINQHGFVLPMLVSIHNPTPNGEGDTLHDNVEFPRMPTPALMHRIKQFSETYREARVYDRFIGITQFIGDLSVCTPSDILGREAAALADNFQRQLPYVLQGQVHAIQEERRQM